MVLNIYYVLNLAEKKRENKRETKNPTESCPKWNQGKYNVTFVFNIEVSGSQIQWSCVLISWMVVYNVG